MMWWVWALVYLALALVTYTVVATVDYVDGGGPDTWDSEDIAIVIFASLLWPFTLLIAIGYGVIWLVNGVVGVIGDSIVNFSKNRKTKEKINKLNAELARLKAERDKFDETKYARSEETNFHQDV